MKIRLLADELFHADGGTDTTKLIIAFSNFTNLPKKLKYAHIDIVRCQCFVLLRI
jgi:hypothetical protein